MTYYLKDNNEIIRQKIKDAGIDVCICTEFDDACWLDYSTEVDNGVHGVGYFGEEIGAKSQQEVLDMFLSQCHDLVECKNVEEFIEKIKQTRANL